MSEIQMEKIKWLSQMQSPIYSVDTHPSNTRFATCQGEKIFIWKSNNYLIKRDEESNEKIQETPLLQSEEYKISTVKSKLNEFLIKEINIHQSNVNCIRFSPNGKYLAAASDDSRVSITKLVKANTENEDWKHFKLLSEHKGDVLAVAWSNDSRFLASCSVDSRVIVYDLKSTNEVCEVIMNRDDHQDHVKGLVFDPIGKYLVSQSDKSLIIWNYSGNQFTPLKIIEKLFKSSLSGIYYRPSFSPCGQTLLFPNVYAKQKHTAIALLRATDFDESHSTNFVGHLDGILCSKFNPVIFNKDDKPVEYFVTAGQDNSIIVWSSVLKSPVVVFTDMFHHQVTDVAWSYDGYTLILSSSDGTAACTTFPEELFGKPFTKEQTENYLKSCYGDVHTQDYLLEHPLTRFDIPRNIITNLTAQNKGLTSSLGSSNISNENKEIHKPPVKKKTTNDPKPPVVQQQTVTTTATGKKRITPIVESFADDDDDTEDEEVNASNDKMSSIMDRIGGVGTTTFGFETVVDQRETQPNTFSSKDIIDIPVTEDNTKKRTRIQRAVEPINDTSSSGKKKKKPNNSNEQPINPLLNNVVPTEPLYLKINNNDELFCSMNGIVEFKQKGSLKWKSTIAGTGGVNIASNYPIMAAATSKFVAICTFPSNQCHIFSATSGMRLTPPMILDSKVEHLNCTGNYLVICTLELMFYLWDLSKMKCIVRASVDSLLSNSGSITTSDESKVVDDVAVTNTGVGIVTLMSGESFAYDKRLKTWLCIADAHTLFSPFLTQGINTEENSDSESDNENLTLVGLRSKAAKALSKFKMENPELSANKEAVNLDTIDDLEIGFTSAASIGDKDSYMHFIKAYVKHLSKQPTDTRLKDLFNSLVGPVDFQSSRFTKPVVKTTNNTDWDPFVAGIPKRKVLQEILLLLMGNLDVRIQRLCKEYTEILTHLQ
ncbi:hypothetical protein ABK040_003643 [Willaertia magna]